MAVDTAEAIAAAEVIVTMLPKGEHVVSVYGDLVQKISAGTLLIDCSTVDMESALKAHELAASTGCPSVDAPVSGGTGGAAAGLDILINNAALFDLAPIVEIKRESYERLFSINVSGTLFMMQAGLRQIS